MVPTESVPDHAPAPEFAARLVAALAAHGVRDVCMSPGSRSTPLVLAFHRQEEIRVHVHLDERSAAFFALGLAKASRRAVAIVCTSGTAAANFLPAVAEADAARVPLVVLTADRPAELRDCGAPQTIDQVRLYGSHVRWFAETPVPEDGEAFGDLAEALGTRAVVHAQGSPPGPVHLNLPFREPLASRAGERAAAAERPPRRWGGSVGVDPEVVSALHELVERHERGLIVCGPLDDPDAADAIATFARSASWPVFADPTSQLRRGPHVSEEILAHGDLLLGATFAAGLAPDVVVRFGAVPVSKSLARWSTAHPPQRWLVVDEGGGFRDPARRATDFVHADPTALCEAVVRRGREPRKRSSWCERFVRADASIAAVLDGALTADAPLLAADVVRTLGDACPDGAQLYVANSMAVRDLDAYLPRNPRPLRILANRGANGIDGLVSSALGAAAEAPTVLLTGDLAFLHDASGLLRAGPSQLPLTIVVVNDDGGGIFSHLPVASLGDAAGFERLFRTPHGLDLATVCQGASLPHRRVETVPALTAALEEASRAATPSVLEITVDAEQNRAQHRALRAQVAHALASS